MPKFIQKIKTELKTVNTLRVCSSHHSLVLHLLFDCHSKYFNIAFYKHTFFFTIIKASFGIMSFILLPSIIIACHCSRKTTFNTQSHTLDWNFFYCRKISKSEWVKEWKNVATMKEWMERKFSLLTYFYIFWHHWPTFSLLHSPVILVFISCTYVITKNYCWCCCFYIYLKLFFFLFFLLECEINSAL